MNYYQTRCSAHAAYFGKSVAIIERAEHMGASELDKYAPYDGLGNLAGHKLREG